ncbi:amidase [Aldersonia sp. NBC_00410]|uniref:amidase n=1 Tax=Aldersonia sp. NBC_00410 TaxID=2975954 RepID=UPI002258DE12|nr:amidase [Aldersonia sp. NBC_00410]MCX5044417.1 amidase [Aldersonia sp. NBC_00410]
MNLDEYFSHDAVGLAELVASREVKPSELLELARRRADTVNPALNAIVARLDDVADERAGDPGLSGPLAGVPFLLKDLLQEYKGFPTSYGSRSLAGVVETEHSLYTQRLLDAGLVIFGKTNTSEFGLKPITEPTYWGPTRNPWNTAHSPGGSSGGSGAAVAAGIVPAAGANDGGGSIRIPASCNGLVGLKPSRGIMPYGPQGGEPLHGFVTQGVVSRSVRDSATLLDVLVGPDPRAAYRAMLPNQPFAEALSTPTGPLRIGFTAASTINPAPHPAALAAMHSAAELLTELGHNVTEATPPCDGAALGRDFLTVWFAEMQADVTRIKRRYGARDKDFEADTLAIAEFGRVSGVATLLLALEARNDHIRQLAQFHERFDLLLTPTVAGPPPVTGALGTPRGAQRLARVIRKARGGRLIALAGIMDDIVSENLGWVPYTPLANVTGRPAISVPLHWTADGLPIGVQFVGPLGSDSMLLRLAAQLERARPWAQRFPARAGG